MGYLLALLILGLIAVIAIQIGKVSDLASRIRGEEEAEIQNNNTQALWLVVFMVLFLVLGAGSAYYYKDVMLGYGPLTASSVHGKELDGLFNVTLIFTGIVFFITQILLFWYSYKYRRQEGVRAKFVSHNNTLELVWTAVPAIVMAFLVSQGLVAWNHVMPDVTPEDEYLEIEATGYQFAWDMRYPGSDNLLGRKDYTLIDPATNSLGLDFNDEKTWDDIVLGGSDQILIPVDTMVRVRITSKDVLHNFYLPHFRVKMDAVPGLPTYFIFTPDRTTEEMRQSLREYPEWNEPYDPEDPESKARWEEFNYELACAELCGKGHYSMKRIIKIVERDEYEEWMASKVPFYQANIRGTENDPNAGKRLLGYEIKNRARAISSEMKGINSKITAANADEAAKAALTEEDLILRLQNVFFATGSSALDKDSNYELQALAKEMNRFPNLSFEVSGHTDSTGDYGANIDLSSDRAASVLNVLTANGVDASRLVSKGYGPDKPVDTNDTSEGRANNRRTELKVIY